MARADVGSDVEDTELFENSRSLQGCKRDSVALVALAELETRQSVSDGQKSKDKIKSSCLISKSAKNI
jgi:hypothetical protein